MHTVLLVARAEARLTLRKRAFWLLLALFSVLLVLAGWLSRVRHVAERDQQRNYQELVREQWENQPDRHPHRVAHYGTFAFRPPGPLAAFDAGVDAYAGRVQFLEAHRQNSANFAEAGALSSAFRLGELSLAFVVQAVLPLVFIILGHAAWVDERESGRLPLLRAQGVSGPELALGKLLGLSAAAVPFLVVAIAASSVAVVTAGDRTALPSDLGPRIGTLLAAHVLHVAGWLVVVALVSSTAGSAARACATLLALWIGGVLVLPRVAGVFAERLHPLPDKSSFTATVAADVRKLGDSHDPDDPHFAEFRAATLARHGVARVEDLPVNYGALVMAEGERVSAETFARHFDALGETMRRQERIVDTTGLLSPYLGVRAVSTSAAGTDLDAQLAFQTQAEAFRYEFVQELNAIHRDEIRFVGDRDQKIEAERWRRFADFSPTPPSFEKSMRGTTISWLALVGWVVAPALFFVRRSRRFA
jgi:ABC-2 type transport system permease protein